MSLKVDDNLSHPGLGRHVKLQGTAPERQRML